MKKHLSLLLGISLISLHPALAQERGPFRAPPGPQRSGRVDEETKPLPRFDMDFPGGTPRDLVKAIDKAPLKGFNAFGGGANGQSLNVIIPDDCANVKIPAISVKNVTVPQLFEAVTPATQETHREYSGFYPGGSKFVVKAYGFRTIGAPNENSIWYFYRDKLPDETPPPVCRFYQLSPYIEAGYKVEDITTAIETAWGMLDTHPRPEIKYHKDTKLLIAVGATDKLRMIDDALEQLSKAIPKEKHNLPAPAKPKTQ